MTNLPDSSTKMQSAGELRARAWVVAVLCAIFWIQLADASTAAPSEDQVKAAFLLNFPKYVDWPQGSFADASSPIVITVVADKGVENELRLIADGKTFNGRPMQIVATIEAGVAPHIVFIDASRNRRLGESIRNLCGQSVLTVGEGDDFFDAGGIIRLARRDRKIRLEIDLVQADAAGLKLSSKLLAVSDVVRRRNR
ncbi:MAG TPA: YfiR family protein [Opitutaceae bacterium]